MLMLLKVYVVIGLCYSLKASLKGSLVEDAHMLACKFSKPELLVQLAMVVGTTLLWGPATILAAIIKWKLRNR